MIDSVICERCGTIQEGHNPQSCFCGNPYLMNIYESKEANEKQLKEVLKNKANKTKFMFRCPTCESEVTFYTADPSQPFCLSCDDLMIRHIDSQDVIDLIYQCKNQLGLTQADVAVKLNTNRQAIADVLRGKSSLNLDQYNALCKMVN